MTLSCYARRGTTGSAWFDDVQLIRITDPPMQVMLRQPVYRGWIMAQTPEKAQVRVQLNLRDYDLRPQEVQIHAQLRDSSTKRWESTVQPGEGVAGVLDLAVPVYGLPPGPYDLELRLTGPGREGAASRSSAFAAGGGRLPAPLLYRRTPAFAGGWQALFPAGHVFLVDPGKRSQGLRSEQIQLPDALRFAD